MKKKKYTHNNNTKKKKYAPSYLGRTCLMGNYESVVYKKKCPVVPQSCVFKGKL